MKLRILGCSGGKGVSKNPTCFLLDNKILIDAGTVVSKVDPDEFVAKIDHSLLTHSHFDHIADLPFIVQLAFENKETPLNIYASKESTEVIFKNIFNYEVWPDLFEISKQKNGNLAWHKYENLKSFSVSDYEVTPILVNHTVTTHGLIVDDGTSSFAFTGDTYTTNQFWEQCNKKENLKSVVVDVSFPSHMDTVAEATKHLTPDLLLEELDKLANKDLDIYINHIKPGFKEEIAEELDEKFLNINHHILKEDTDITI